MESAVVSVIPKKETMLLHTAPFHPCPLPAFTPLPARNRSQPHNATPLSPEYI